MWSGSSVLASGDYYRFDFTWKKEKLYDEYGRTGHKNQQQIIRGWNFKLSSGYEYYANGMKYTNEGAAIRNHTPQVGTRVPVMYNPTKPKQSYIPGYDNKVYKILTIVFGIIGCIPILVCIGIFIFTCL